MTAQLFIVEVHDRCEPRLVDYPGCHYSSPPQPAKQALTLVRLLLGCPTDQLDAGQAPWQCAIAGGRRTIRLHTAHADGQLHL
jgi:hypothetical protein